MIHFVIPNKNMKKGRVLILIGLNSEGLEHEKHSMTIQTLRKNENYPNYFSNEKNDTKCITE